MKKLTDEDVARALGFKAGKKTYKPGKFSAWHPLPKWTTSLNAIVAEYRARKIPFQLQVDETGAIAHADGKKAYSIGTHDNAAPLALAQALCAYLKEAPKGDR